jgi:integrase
MPRKAAPVEGVYEKVPGSGNWYARYRNNGKLVRKGFGKDRGAAVRYVEKARTLLRSGEGIVPATAKRPVLTLNELEQVGGAVTVNELCDDYVHHVQTRPDLFKDQRNPAQRVELIRDAFGTRPAAGIRAWEIDDWLSSLKKRSTRGGGVVTTKPLKPASLNRLKAHLSAIYQHGRLRDKVQVNPARDVKQRRMNNGVIRFMSEKEETSLRGAMLGWIESKAHLAQYQEHLVHHRICELDIALGTGMRKGEQYGLRWRDIDFTTGVITLRDTKNGTARTVHMIDDVVAAFKRLRRLRTEGRNLPAKDELVFAIGDNKKWWAQAVKDAKIDHLRWHDLRHTFCSRLAQNGVSLKVIQEAAGHKTIAMSARYAHLDTSSLKSAMSVLNRKAS